MDEVDLCRRNKFLDEHASEIVRILEPLVCRSETINFITLLESLKNASDHEFLVVCHSMLESGHYSLFSELLEKHVIDCESLEVMAKDFVESYFLLVLDFLNENFKYMEDIQTHEPLSNFQSEFLRRHNSTLKSLLRIDKILDYLKCTFVISTEQYYLIKNLSSNDGISALADFLTSQNISLNSLSRFCHGLLLTGQYRLYSILHKLVDSKRLEFFYGQYSDILSENDENHNCTVTGKDFYNYSSISIHQTSLNNGHFVVVNKSDEGEGIPETDGILMDLKVKMIDPLDAKSHYERNKGQVYKNCSNPKGLALIINNWKFHMLNDRKGTEVDQQNISNLLTQLGYKVLPACQDLTALEIEATAKKFATLSDHQRMHSCVVVVLSHGEHDTITGVDGRPVITHKFFSYFNAKNAPFLAGKPRIFIMQACRGEHDHGVERQIAIDEPDCRETIRIQKSNLNNQNSLNSFLNNERTTNNRDLYDHNYVTEISPGGSPIKSSSTKQSFFSRFGLRFGSSRSSNSEKHSHQQSPSQSLENENNFNNIAQISTNSRQETSRGLPRTNIRELSLPRSSITAQGGRSIFSFNEKAPQNLREFFPRQIIEGPVPREKRYKTVREPTDSDMLIAYATTPHYVSWRNIDKGTWFIQSICQIFSQYACNEDILTMLTRVNDHVARVYQSTHSGEKQAPEFATRLRRKFFFYPGFESEEYKVSNFSP